MRGDEMIATWNGENGQRRTNLFNSAKFEILLLDMYNTRNFLQEASPSSFSIKLYDIHSSSNVPLTSSSFSIFFMAFRPSDKIRREAEGKNSILEK